MEDNMLIGVIDNYEKADSIINNSQKEGFSPANISIIMKELSELNGKEKQMLIESVSGHSLSIKTIEVVNAGKLIILGPIAAALNIEGSTADSKGGTIVGSLAAGIVNALMDIGLTEEDSRAYEKEIKQGKILLGISINSEDENKAIEYFGNSGVQDLIYLTYEYLS